MFKRNLQRGFTLIELLVVIAIIGILAATVLASLGTARSSGSDASIKGSVNSAKAQAEVYYSSTNPNTYDGVCAAAVAANGLTQIRGAIDTNIGTAAVKTPDAAGAQTAADISCNDSAAQWALSSPLNTTGAGYFCADWTGFSGNRTLPLAAGATVCPAS